MHAVFDNNVVQSSKNFSGSGIFANQTVNCMSLKVSQTSVPSLLWSLFELSDVKMYLRAPPVIPGHVSAVLLAAPLDAPAHVPGAGGAGRGGRVGGAGRQLAVVPGVTRHTAAQVHTPTLCTHLTHLH